MPEGDTLFIAAKKLDAVLTGRTITRFATPLPELKERGVEGQTVKAVRAQGKHVIIELSDGRALLSFLRMQGTWSVFDKSRMPAKLLEKTSREPKWDDEDTTLVIETETTVAVLRRAALAELGPLAKIEARLSGLGPDILSPDYDQADVLARLRDNPELSVAEALLRQSIVAGIGNVYKSEVLFLEKVSPFASLGSLDDGTLERVLKRARELMRRNLGKGARRTTFGTFAGPNYFVYERSGQHCLKCDAKIGMRRQGTLQRSTYFCPDCQGVA